ncbi:MAG TPA: 23S rRNA (uracil(1939)-C(5))-methyltransferase RlmD [Methylomirabilota bacterium]|nr:23S rRNA (uracil(1939)-C(5))-methyltransferase RlmD [Methylomirabilota bacterium]
MGRPQRGQSLSVTIDDLAFGGEGVGRIDGYVVFVRGGIPGDQLRVRLDQARARFGRASIEAVLTPSPHRVEAPCQYFGRCGGCRLQHVDYAAQLSFKSKQVADALERLGGLPPVEIRPILAAPETYGYRNKMEFTVASQGPNHPLTVGLHEAERYDRVLDVDRCLLQSERMNALLDESRRFFVEHGLTAYEQDSGEGLLRFLMLREGRRTDEAMVNVVTSSPAVSELAPLAERLAARVKETASVVMNVNPKKASVAVGIEEHLLGGRDHIRESVGGLTFQVSANSFFQTNSAQTERLFTIVLEAAALTGGETVFDLYAGTGAISLLLAQRSRWVYGVEVAQAAVDDAARNAAANGISNCTFLAGEVRFVLPELIAQGVTAQVVVADPPRAGFHPKALASLARLAPARISYVSCNPATLARDLGDLARAGYRVEWVQPVDMFPHTPHIEAVARLERIQT